MAARKSSLKKADPGRAEFLVQEDGVLAIHLDRLGFRRLLKTLERLAENGEFQEFESSGPQTKSRNGRTRQRRSVTSLAFHLDEQTSR